MFGAGFRRRDDKDGGGPAKVALARNAEPACIPKSSLHGQKRGDKPGIKDAGEQEESQEDGNILRRCGRLLKKAVLHRAATRKGYGFRSEAARQGCRYPWFSGFFGK